jgi:hypothetical protein
MNLLPFHSAGALVNLLSVFAFAMIRLLKKHCLGVEAIEADKVSLLTLVLTRKYIRITKSVNRKFPENKNILPILAQKGLLFRLISGSQLWREIKLLKTSSSF